jgi:NADH dehydrogenase [ubiquinone] 1 alpha subcomplex assembly factor 7
MTGVPDFIRGVIAQDGPIPVSRFFELALSARDDSYYMSRDPFGPGGDFITAPEISQVFGECIGAWCIDLWMQMGSPSSFRLVELGPGRGTLMSDILRAGHMHAPFIEACTLSLVEVSPVLRALQQQRLAAFPMERSSWFERFEHIPSDRPMIVIANEFFDALPARQFMRTEKGWFERCVGLDSQGQFVFGVAPEPELGSRIPPGLVSSRRGSVFESSEASVLTAGLIGRALRACGGALLAIDYGFEGPAIGDTLQAIKSHRHVPVLEHVGECDLTFHVDFSTLAAALSSQGAHCLAVVEQGDLLRRLGALERTRHLKARATAAQVQQLDNAFVRLTSPEGMGTLFKALCAVSPTTLSPAGFPAS